MSDSSAFAQLDTDEQKRLLDKLAKLKALSQCQTGNVNETATAAATMTRIMLEYQIGIADLEAGSDPEEQEVFTEPAFPEDSYNGFPTWKSSILSALADVNHCVSFSSSEPEVHLWMRRTRSRLSVIGTRQDIDNTLKLFHFCAEEIERLCWRWGLGESVKRKNDFKRGAGTGVARKVREERDRVIQEEQERARANSQTSHALEHFERKEEAVAAVAASIGLVTKARRTSKVHIDAYRAGYSAGANLDLSRGSRPGLPAARS